MSKYNFNQYKQFFDVPESFRKPFEDGLHIKLEQSDNNNNFSWLDEEFEKYKDFFLYHVKMTSIWDWTNFKNWYKNYLNQKFNKKCGCCQEKRSKCKCSIRDLQMCLIRKQLGLD